MQPSAYYPEGLKAASIATNAHCVAQAAAGGLRSMEEGSAFSLHRDPHPARRLPIGTSGPSQYSHKTVCLIHQQNVISKTSDLAVTSAARMISQGLVSEPYLYMYSLNVK